MNNCFIDCPQVQFPFTADDFFGDYDYDLINGNIPLPSELILQGEKIKWSNWSSDNVSFLEGTRFENEKQEENFNSAGLIYDTNLKHDVWDWMNDTFHPIYFQEIWKTSHGNAHPPVTVLCFSRTTGWHKEGPVPIPSNVPESFDTGFITNWRPPAVINFRLLGDIEGSQLEFSEPNEKMAQAEEELIQKFFDTSVSNSDAEKSPLQAAPGVRHFGGNKVTVPTFVKHRSMIMDARQHWIQEGTYKNALTHIATHYGMHNPYIVNISQWHRVITNGMPRVTLRVHANTNLTFTEIEQLVEAGKFFK